MYGWQRVLGSARFDQQIVDSALFDRSRRCMATAKKVSQEFLLALHYMHMIQFRQFSRCLSTRQSKSRPTLSVSPLATALIKLVHLPPCLRRVAQINRLHLLGLDDDHTEIGPSHGILQVFDLLSSSKILVVIRLVHRLAGRRVLESS